jgi:hypothetical protein
MSASKINIRHRTSIGLTAAATAFSTICKDKGSTKPAVCVCSGMECGWGTCKESLGPVCSDAVGE